MKKSIKVLSGICAFILIGGILWFANVFLGNPISKTIAKNTAEKYISQNYSDKDVKISDVSYSFKDGNYNVYVKSPSSKDTHFTISISPLGKIGYDSYEDDVLKKYNTYTRVNEKYGLEVKKILENKEIPYRGDIYFGEVKDVQSQELNNEFEPKYGLDINDLELDKNYNINEIGKKYGHIIFCAQDKDVSTKKASEILLDLKNLLDENNISFYTIDFTLEKPRTKEKTNPNDKSISIREFLYSDIYKKDLENRIKVSSEKLEKYYEKQDNIKQKEIEETEK
ncbi:YfjL-like protein [Terrisporobacter sp.]